MNHLDYAERPTGTASPTKSAKVFGTPELCKMVVDLLGRNDMLSLQSASRDFFHAVTPHIWQELPSFLPLALLLADPQTLSPLNTGHSLRRSLQKLLADPSRGRSFVFYAHLVKTLRLDSDGAKGFQWQVFSGLTGTPDQFSTMPPALGRHLTNLRKIVVDDPDNAFTHRKLSHLYRCGVNASATDFILKDQRSERPWLSSSTAPLVLRHLRSNGANLRRLDICILATSQSEREHFSVHLEEALAAMTELQQLGLSVDAVSSRVMAAVGALRELRTLNLYGRLQRKQSF
ncbi:hypothetical protein FRC10_012187, partial [Ceratobasidium sp. 414]